MDVQVTKEQIDELISEFKRFNDIFLVFVQRGGTGFATQFPVQELPKPRVVETAVIK
jgi:hypothetical protein